MKELMSVYYFILITGYAFDNVGAFTFYLLAVLPFALWLLAACLLAPRYEELPLSSASDTNFKHRKKSLINPRFKIKGQITTMLEFDMPYDQYSTLRNIELKYIDKSLVFVVSRFGVFMIKGIHHEESISGSVNREEWAAHKENKQINFKNPNIGIQKDIQTITQKTRITPEQIFPVIVFTHESQLNEHMPSNAICLEQLVSYIKSKTVAIYSSDQFENITYSLDRRYSNPANKMNGSEKHVNHLIEKHLPSNQYRLLPDVTLPTHDGSTQVDHIIVSEYGIFVIETKGMSGWIFGSVNQQQWTQRFYKESYRFQNPLRQNHKHIKTLQEYLKLPSKAFLSVIVFDEACEFKTDMPANVLKEKALISYIKKNDKPTFSGTEVESIVQTINEVRLERSVKVNEAHIKHVENLISDKTSSSGNKSLYF